MTTTTPPRRSAFDIAADIIDDPDDTWEPLPHQIKPPGQWFAWLLMGGRGMGKTATAARYIHEHVMGPPCIEGVPGGHWVGIIGPTLGDAVTSCALGPSGLRLHDPALKVRQTAGGTTVRWSNGAEGKIFGAHSPEDVERLRSGGNRCMVWAEELAAWRYMTECWQHMRYGLRVGPWPHVIISTTPKNRMLIKELRNKAINGDVDPESGEREVVMTTATTEENPHLDQRVRRALYEDYGGTRLGRQELLGQILEDVESALWVESIIEANRVTANSDLAPNEFDALVVSVDPAVGGENEHGIVVVGKKNTWPPRERWEMDRKIVEAREPHLLLPHGFILDDLTCTGSPNVWAKKAINAYHNWDANYIVAERNNGGEMVMQTIHSLDPTVPVKLVWATKGKARRAEPVSLAYEQGRGHHVGTFPELEQQMTEFDPVDPDDAWSPDRMDAMVWGMTELLGTGQQVTTRERKDTRLRHRR